MSNGEKAYVFAFAVVMAVSAGLSFFIASRIEIAFVPRIESAAHGAWIMGAGALAGFFALFAARSYLGGAGTLGLLRAVVGSTAAGIIAAAIAGTLIMPIYGTFYAPVLVVSEFVAQPWLAVAWYAAMFAAHLLMKTLLEERAWGYGRETSRRPVTSQLSALTRAQLYHRD